MKFKGMLGLSFVLLSCFALASDAPAISKITPKDITLGMVSQIKVGSSNRAQVTELLGVPWRTVNYGDCNPIAYQELWAYLGPEAGGLFRLRSCDDVAGSAA